MSDSSNEKLEGDIAGIICKWHGGTEPCRVCLKIAPEIVALLPDVRREERERIIKVARMLIKYGGNQASDSYNQALLDLEKTLKEE